MEAVGAGIGGYSNSSTSNRTQHGITIKEVKKHERANTREPKESTAISPNERAQNSHKLNTNNGKSSHERANNREAKEPSTLSPNERAQNSHKLGPNPNSKVNERSNQSSSTQKAHDSKADNAITDNSTSIGATTASSGIIKSSKDIVKKAGTAASAVIDVKTIATSKSDFKKGVAVASLATTAVGGPAAVGIATNVANIVYDSASPEVQKKLDAFAAEPKDAYGKNLNKVEASTVNNKKATKSTSSKSDRPEPTRRRRRRKSRRKRPSRSNNRYRSRRSRSSRSSRSRRRNSRTRSIRSRRSRRRRRR